MKNTSEYILNYQDKSLGFTLILPLVRLVSGDGEKYPDIDPRILIEIGARALLGTPVLTGGMIKFIRTYGNLSRLAFGELIDISKTTIATWEEGRDEPVRLDQIQLVAIKSFLKRKIDEKMDQLLLKTSNPPSETSTNISPVVFANLQYGT